MYLGAIIEQILLSRSFSSSFFWGGESLFEDKHHRSSSQQMVQKARLYFPPT
jgi:hypothetical protein